MQILRMLVVVMSMVVAVVACAVDAHAILMNSLALDPQYRANADDRVGFIRVSYSDGTSAVASFVSLNEEWGITAAHVVDRDHVGFEAGFGLDADLPDIARTIDDYIIYPDWTGSRSNSHDIALVHYSTPMYGVATAQLTDHQPAKGEVLNFTGYGRPGIEGQNLAYDGVRRGFDSQVDSFGTPLYGGLANYYIGSLWKEPGYGGLPLSGRGNPGDSGGGVFDVDGLLVALIVSASGANTPLTWTDTFAVGLWEESTLNWIEANAYADSTPVPEPGTLLLFGSGCIGLAGMLRRKRG